MLDRINRIILGFDIIILICLMAVLVAFALQPQFFVYSTWGSDLKMMSGINRPNDVDVNKVLANCKYVQGKDQIGCVVDGINMFYRFNDTKDCKDYAASYDYIFTRLGWSNQFVFVPGHVYNNIYRKTNSTTEYCEINVDRYNCW